jgi:hypothetical protein
MGVRIDRVKDELIDFWKEVVIENGPRYRDPREWFHLWTDLWVALCDMSYTVGHVLAVAVPALIVAAWLF